MPHPAPRSPLISGPKFIDGEWCSHNGGYTVKVGDLFVGHVEQRGGDSIYKECWTVTLNGKHVTGGGNDQAYAQGLVERLILSELQRLAPVFRAIIDRAPPGECFFGENSHARWMGCKAARDLPPYKAKAK